MPNEGTALASEAATTPAQTFGAQLRETRVRKGWSQQQLAARLAELGLPIHPTAITRIEHATRKVTLEESLLLALALGVSPLHLIAPREDEATVDLGQGEPARATQFREWLRGEQVLGDVSDDELRFFVMEQAGSDWRFLTNDAWQSASVIRSLLRRFLRGEVQSGYEQELLADIHELIGQLSREVRQLHRET